MTSGKTIASLGWKGLAFAAGAAAFLGLMMSAPAMAAGTQGYALFGSYDTNEFENDNIVRLVDPLGCGNGAILNVACHGETELCAMIYVFDNDQEMGECCGCPMTPNELQVYSVTDNLADNWALASGPSGSGVVVIGVGVPQNSNYTCSTNSGRTNPACNFGCDPTQGFQPASTIFGSISGAQQIGTKRNLTELPLFNNGVGDPVDDAYLVNECGVLVANGSGSGYCTCPTEPDSEP